MRILDNTVVNERRLWGCDGHRFKLIIGGGIVLRRYECDKCYGVVTFARLMEMISNGTAIETKEKNRRKKNSGEKCGKRSDSGL